MTKYQEDLPPLDNLGHGFGCRWGAVVVALSVALITLILIVASFVGFVSVGQGQYIILVKKTGTPIDNKMLLASGPEYQGVQADFVGQGYHFYNPYTWTWIGPKEATIIHDGKVGILVRKF